MEYIGTTPAEAEGSEDEKKQVFRQVRDMLDAKIREWLGQQGAGRDL